MGLLPDSLWTMDEEDSKMILPTNEPFHSLFGQGSTFYWVTGLLYEFSTIV